MRTLRGTKEREEMCTSSIVKNIAAQLRYGIRNGLCTDNPEDRCKLPPNGNPTPLPTIETFSPTSAPRKETVTFDQIGQIVEIPRMSSLYTPKVSINQNGTRIVVSRGFSGGLEVYELASENQTKHNSSNDTTTVWKHMESSSDESFYEAAMSGDGTHVGGVSFSYYEGAADIVVYQLNDNNTKWSPKGRITFPIEGRNATGHFIQESLTMEEGESLTDTTWKLVAISGSGDRIAFSVFMYESNDIAWQPAFGKSHLVRGVAVYQWNGTGYDQLGQTVAVGTDNVEIPSVQMDTTGNYLYLKGVHYTYSSRTMLWEAIDRSMPRGLVSPSGSRVASFSYDSNNVTIYERDDVTFRWKEISTISNPFKHNFAQSLDGYLYPFGSWMSWSQDGKRLLISHPTREKPRIPSQPQFQGAVYLYEETGCATEGMKGSACPFELMSEVPCTKGKFCGITAELSSEGNRVFHATRVDTGEVYATAAVHKVRSVGSVGNTRDERMGGMLEFSNEPDGQTSARGTSSSSEDMIDTEPNTPEASLDQPADGVASSASSRRWDMHAVVVCAWLAKIIWKVVV